MCPREEIRQATPSSAVPGLASVHCTGGCNLTYTYTGQTHTHDYSNDLSQFCRCPSGSVTPVLIDPQHPDTMFTVHDVRHATNAGLGVFGVFCIVGSLILAFLTLWLGRALRRFVPLTALRPDPPAGIQSPFKLALAAVDATEDVLFDGSLLSSKRQTYRFDGDKLLGALTHLREQLAAAPNLEPSMLEAADLLIRTVRDAPRMPIIGGVRLPTEPLHDALDQLRPAIIAAVIATR